MMMPTDDEADGVSAGDDGELVSLLYCLYRHQQNAQLPEWIASDTLSTNVLHASKLQIDRHYDVPDVCAT